MTDVLLEDGVRSTESMESSLEGAASRRAGFASRDEIPSGCVLSDNDKLPDGARCLFSDQCQAARCCPYMKVCNPPMTEDQVKADPLIKAIMWPSKYGGDAQCGKDVCDTCAFRSTPTKYQCTDVNKEPILEGSVYAAFMPLWNTEDSACKCDKRFLDSMKDGSWVPACGGQQGGSSSGGGQTGGKPGKPEKPEKPRKPRKEPTAEPTPAPTAPQRPAGGTGSCKDSVGYKDPKWALTCSEWIGYGCDGWAVSEDLIANCPCSCGSCDSDSYVDPYFKDACKNWVGYECTGHDFSNELQANCPRACKLC